MSPKTMKLPDESRTFISKDIAAIHFDPRKGDPPSPFIINLLDERSLIAVAKLQIEHDIAVSKLRMEEERLMQMNLQKLIKLIPPKAVGP